MSRAIHKSLGALGGEKIYLFEAIDRLIDTAQATSYNFGSIGMTAAGVGRRQFVFVQAQGWDNSTGRSLDNIQIAGSAGTLIGPAVTDNGSNLTLITGIAYREITPSFSASVVVNFTNGMEDCKISVYNVVTGPAGLSIYNSASSQNGSGWSQGIPFNLSSLNAYVGGACIYGLCVATQTSPSGTITWGGTMGLTELNDEVMQGRVACSNAYRSSTAGGTGLTVTITDTETWERVCWVGCTIKPGP